jgi:hypothetical protein
MPIPDGWLFGNDRESAKSQVTELFKIPAKASRQFDWKGARDATLEAVEALLLEATTAPQSKGDAVRDRIWRAAKELREALEQADKECPSLVPILSMRRDRDNQTLRLSPWAVSARPQEALRHSLAELEAFTSRRYEGPGYVLPDVDIVDRAIELLSPVHQQFAPMAPRSLGSFVHSVLVGSHLAASVKLKTVQNHLSMRNKRSDIPADL